MLSSDEIIQILQPQENLKKTESQEVYTKNENELINVLKLYNFRLVNFEDYDYETQINIARNCKIMIGYHGAGLTNLFYMKQKALVIEIFNNNYKHEHFKFFSKALGIVLTFLTPRL